METKIEVHEDRIVCTIIVNGGVHDRGVVFHFEEGCMDSMKAALGEAEAWACGVESALEAVSASMMLKAVEASKRRRSVQTIIRKL